MKSQEICREEQAARVKGMLLSNMLEYLNIPVDRYFQMTSDQERETHIYRCKGCLCLRDCVHMLLGEQIDPAAFCPNFGELKRLM